MKLVAGSGVISSIQTYWLPIKPGKPCKPCKPKPPICGGGNGSWEIGGSWHIGGSWGSSGKWC